MKKTFSIIIPSWNNLPYLKNCIESLQKNSQFEHPLVTPDHLIWSAKYDIRKCRTLNCKEIMDLYPMMKLVDYGFVYHRDPVFKGDDYTWFLLEKSENDFRK